MSSIVEQFGRRLCKSFEPGQLVYWLRGEKWPEGNWQRQPFELLLTAALQTESSARARRNLAIASSVLLELRPDLNPSVFGALSGVVLHNLLNLCSGLALPSVLAPQLNEMRSRKKLKGSQDEILFESSLLEALAANQSGIGLRSYWTDMLAAKRGLFPKGTPVDGFRGLVKCTEKPGEPDAPNIAVAVERISEHLESRWPNRKRQAMRDLFAYTASQFPLSTISWHDVFDDPTVRIPAWCVESLGEKLFPFERKHPNGDSTLVIPTPVLRLVPKRFEEKIERLRICYGGAASEVRATNGAALFLKGQPSSLFESFRVSVRSEEPLAIDTLLVHVLLELEANSSDVEEKREFQKFRKDILRGAGLLESEEVEIAKDGGAIVIEISKAIDRKAGTRPAASNHGSKELFKLFAKPSRPQWTTPAWK